MHVRIGRDTKNGKRRRGEGEEGRRKKKIEERHAEKVNGWRAI